MTQPRPALALFAAPATPRPAETLDAKWRISFTQAPAPEDAPKALVVPIFEDQPWLELVRLLNAAAEIEHCLLVQYLYAAFSVKPDFGDLAVSTPESLGFMGLAQEEMRHLDTVNQFLVALGQPPRLTRPDLPAAVGIYPFPFQLEPLSAKSLAKYVYTEAPSGFMAEPEGEDPFADRVRKLLEGKKPNQLGSLYHTIAARLDETAAAEPLAEPALGWGHWRARVEEIRLQGEGGHFEFLRTVLDGSHPALRGDPQCWDRGSDDRSHPARALECDPGILQRPPPADRDGTWKLKRLANAHYWLVLAMLDARYAHEGIHASLAMRLRGCAIEHMKKALGQIGAVLAESGAGLPFDSLPAGYRWGRDAKSSLDSIVRMLRRAERLDEEAVAEKLLPNLTASRESLVSLGAASGG